MTVMGGGSRSNGEYWTWHLQRTDAGQSFAIRDVVGLMGQDMGGWFEQMEAMAAGGNTSNYFYHFHLDPREGEAFTPEQLKIAVATALENLGLEDQPYFLVEHDKEGRSPHFHCIVLRVDLDTGKAISDSKNFAIHTRTADQLEELFGHERTSREQGPDGPNPKGYEVKRGRETGIDPKAVAAELKDLWRQTDTGQAFAAAVEDRGYILADGDRGFVVIDRAGDLHSVPRRLNLRAAQVNARMADIDLDAIPTVAEARALARERAAENEKRDEPRDAPSLPVQQQDKKHSPGAIENIVEELAETLHPRPAEKQAPSPAPEYVPIQTREASLFERMAQKAADVLGFLRGDRTVAESIDPLARLAQSQPAQVPAAAADPAGIKRVATEVIEAAEKAAPAVEQLATVAATIIEHRPAEAELSAFERQTAERFEVLRAAPADDLLIREGIDWQARQTGTPFLAETRQGGEPTAFERATQEAFEATRDNGGEPVTGDGSSFWRRARSAIAKSAQWVRDTARNFVDRLRHQRDRGHDDHERER